MPDELSWFRDHVECALEPALGAETWWIAYSGGRDSTVLLSVCLDILNQYRQASAKSQSHVPELKAIHVNHGLQPDAARWAAHCKRVCQELAVPFHAVNAEVKTDGKGIEAAARTARYQAFTDVLTPGDWLFQGHHGQDQAETLLFRLVRGEGIAGLAGIPKQRRLGEGKLLRPLLEIEPRVLEHYADSQGLSWIEDPSNADLTLDRNFLRHRILPIILERWPQAVNRLQQASVWQKEAVELSGALAEVDLQAESKSPTGLPFKHFFTLSPVRQKNLLHYWLRRQRVPLSEGHLLSTLAALQQRDASSPIRLPLGKNRWLESRNGYLQIQDDIAAKPNSPLVWEGQLTVETPLGVLMLDRAVSDSILLRLPTDGETVRIDYRKGGERFRPLGRRGSCTLKKWLQENRIPSRQRDKLPLIFYGGQLAAVADLVLDEKFIVKGGEGILIRLRRQD